jgi:hypothetical protein
MLLIREVMNCKPGKVRPLVDKFKAMAAINEKLGMGKMRILTDFSGAPYWTLVAEFEVENMKVLEDMFAGQGMNDADMKKMEEIMKGYHDLVDKGRREIYKVES